MACVHAGGGLLCSRALWTMLRRRQADATPGRIWQAWGGEGLEGWKGRSMSWVVGGKGLGRPQLGIDKHQLLRQLRLTELVVPPCVTTHNHPFTHATPCGPSDFGLLSPLLCPPSSSPPVRPQDLLDVGLARRAALAARHELLHDGKGLRRWLKLLVSIADRCVDRCRDRRSRLTRGRPRLHRAGADTAQHGAGQLGGALEGPVVAKAVTGGPRCRSACRCDPRAEHGPGPLAQSRRSWGAACGRLGGSGAAQGVP